MAAYRKNPEKFKKHSALLETAFNAFAVEDAIRQMPTSLNLPSDSLGVTPLRSDPKFDSWGNSYCLLASGNQFAIVSF